jgi:hypothetical protein
VRIRVRVTRSAPGPGRLRLGEVLPTNDGYLSLTTAVSEESPASVFLFIFLVSKQPLDVLI